jgi:hypothetical protein
MLFCRLVRSSQNFLGCVLHFEFIALNRCHLQELISIRPSVACLGAAGGPVSDFQAQFLPPKWLFAGISAGVTLAMQIFPPLSLMSALVLKS